MRLRSLIDLFLGDHIRLQLFEGSLEPRLASRNDDFLQPRLSPLESVAGLTKVMDDAFIAPSGTDVTDAFADYLRPLLGSQMPRLAGFGPERVAKILNR